MNIEKVVIKDKEMTKTGYYNEFGNFILHSFEDEPAITWNTGSKEWWEDGFRHRNMENLPAIIYDDGSRIWYNNGYRFWFIDNKRYNTLDDVLIIHKDKIIKVDNDISSNLTCDGVDYIYLNYKHGFRFLILDDTQRNEVILRYT